MTWLSGYLHRSDISVGAISGGSTNVPLEIIVHKSTGSNSAGHLYLADTCVSFPDDIAVTTSNGTTAVPYLVMWSDANSARLLINLPVVPASGTTIYYLYSGKSGATSLSDRLVSYAGSDFLQSTDLVIQDAGTAEDYGNASGTIQTDADKLELVSVNRTSDSYVKINVCRRLGLVTSASYLDAPEDAVVYGNYIYIANRTGASLTIYNISNPSSPSFVSEFTDADISEGMDVKLNATGTIAYVSSWTNHKLVIVDVSTPTSPSKLGSVTVGGDGASTDRLRKIALMGTNYVCCCHTSENKLYIVDVSTPSTPSVVGNVAVSADSQGAYGIAVSGDYAYVGTQLSNKLVVVDCSTKSSPSVVKTLTDTTYYDCLSGEISGNYYYCASYAKNSVVIFDISDPENTAEAGKVTSASLAGPNRLKLDDDCKYAYTPLYSANGFAVVDVSTAASPALVVTCPDSSVTPGQGLVLSGDYVICTGRTSDSFGIYQAYVPRNTDWVVYSKLKISTTSQTTGGYLFPIFAVSLHGESQSLSSTFRNLGVSYYDDDGFRLIEWYGTGSTMPHTDSSTITTTLNTEYILQMYKHGSTAYLYIYGTDGSAIGNASITLNDNDVDYDYLRIYDGKCYSGYSSQTFSGEIYYMWWSKKLSTMPAWETPDGPFTGGPVYAYAQL